MSVPMPLHLDAVSWLTVTDSSGRTLRSEEVKAGAYLGTRPRLAHLNYQLKGWTVEELLPGRWSFIASKASRRLVIGIRRGSSSAGGETSGVQMRSARQPNHRCATIP
jgi:hypothetical protein